jgi:hypothetical protein
MVRESKAKKAKQSKAKQAKAAKAAHETLLSAAEEPASFFFSRYSPPYLMKVFFAQEKLSFSNNPSRFDHDFPCWSRHPPLPKGSGAGASGRIL